MKPQNCLSVVCWRWGTKYPAGIVNCLYSMVKRHLHIPFNFYCITDDSLGLNRDIRVVTWPFEYAGRARRLKIFDKSVQGQLGPRILQLDLDCVITGDITPLVDRKEPLVVWQSVHNTRWVVGMRAEGYEGGAMVNNIAPRSNPYNASFILMDAGVFPALWDEYTVNPGATEMFAKRAGYWTAIVKEGLGVMLEPGDDDQAVFTLYAKELNPATVGESEGIYKYKRIKPGLPADARLVFFQGRDIMDYVSQSPWILEHYQ